MEEDIVPIDELLDEEILSEIKARASRDNDFRFKIIAEFNDDADPDITEFSDSDIIEEAIDRIKTDPDLEAALS